MSKLDEILITLCNEAISLPEGKKWKINRSKQAIKTLILELTDDQYTEAFNRGVDDPIYEAFVELRRKIFLL